MKNFARIVAFCALAAGACLAPPEAHAQTSLRAMDSFVPRLGATVSSFLEPTGFGASVVIHQVYQGSPLRRMYSDVIGWFHADPGDAILSANGAPINDAAQLNYIVDNISGRMSITIRDGRTGNVYSGWVYPL